MTFNNDVHSYFSTKTFSDASVSKLFELVLSIWVERVCRLMWQKLGTNCVKWHFSFLQFRYYDSTCTFCQFIYQLLKISRGSEGVTISPFPPITNYASRWKAPFHADHWHMAELLFGYSTHKKYAPLWSFVCLTFKAFLCAFLFTIQQKGEQLYKMQWC